MLQQALAAISGDGRFTVIGSQVMITGQKAGGSVSHNGKKYVLSVSGQEIELGSQMDSTALSILDRHLRMRRAVGD